MSTEFARLWGGVVYRFGAAVVTLTIDRVSKSFGATRAVDGVSLTVPDGQMLALLGPSGCGKTTLLRMVAGLEHPDAGRIMADGTPLGLGDSAMVFQDAPLYPHLTVAQNVGFPLRLGAGRRTPDAKRRVSEALELLRIGHLGSRRPEELSGGQKQRVGIARALVRDVGVQLFDEPLAHLDEALATDILDDLRRIRAERGLTGVYVTHSSREAFALGDDVAVMRDGRVEQTGTAREIWEAPASRFVADFVGGRPMNDLEAEGRHWCFRPEHVGVVRGAAHEAPAAALTFPAVVTDVVYLGEDVALTVVPEERPGVPVRAVMRAGERGGVPDVGERVTAWVPEGSLHRFDTATGERRGS